MDVETLDRFLLGGALVVVAAIAAVRVGVRLGLPSLLLYLLIGVGLAQAFPGAVIQDAKTAHALGFAALVVILAEGGLTTRWASVRPAMPLGAVLATVGVGVSTAVVAVALHVLLDLDWTTAVLLGAVFSPTDAAAVFSTLRRLPIRQRVAGSLESESGLNDAPTVLLVTLISTGEAVEAGPLRFAAIVVYELAVGVAVGLAVGWLGVRLLRAQALPASGLYPLAVMTLAVLAYGTGVAAHASGFASVYVAALVLGNADLPHRAPARSFAEGLAWVAQIGLFVMLGLLASPGTLLDAVGPALLAGAVLTLVARPLSVLVSAAPFRMPWREQAFLSWAGLRGAVPVVLATIPLAQGVPEARWIFDIVFVVAFVFTLLQAPPLPWLAGRLGVLDAAQARDVELEVAPLDRLETDLLTVTVTERSRLHGVEVGELRLPPHVSLTLVVRGGRSFVPGVTTRLHRGDELLVVAPRRLRESAERRIQAVSRNGRLAGWFGEDGASEPQNLLPLRLGWRPPWPTDLRRLAARRRGTRTPSTRRQR